MHAAPGPFKLLRFRSTPFDELRLTVAGVIDAGCSFMAAIFHLIYLLLHLDGEAEGTT